MTLPQPTAPSLRPPDRAEPLTLDRPRIMGILNVTPDSFSDGGRHDHVEAAVAHALQMASEGAAIIDIGGESTRPGAERIDASQQLERVLPVIRALQPALAERYPGVLISIDTTRRAVAEPACDAGATLINDVTAGRDDPDLLALAGERGLPIILMHMQGEPATMQQAPQYTDVVGEVQRLLEQQADAATRAGVPADQIVIDPGIGFGKTTRHNLLLLNALQRFVATGRPVMLGASRKGFVGKVSAPPAGGPGEPGKLVEPAEQRIGGTCATTALAVAGGVHLLRVHDVRANRQAAEVAWAIAHPDAGWPD